MTDRTAEPGAGQQDAADVEACARRYGLEPAGLEALIAAARHAAVARRRRVPGSDLDALVRAAAGLPT